MKTLKMALCFNTCFYYLVVLACPMLFTLRATCDGEDHHGTAQDHQATTKASSDVHQEPARHLSAAGTVYALKDHGDIIYSHIIYAVFAVYSLIFEIVVVHLIDRKVQNKKILKFGSWHVIELIMG
jgi:hypothetical protein